MTISQSAQVIACTDIEMPWKQDMVPGILKEIQLKLEPHVLVSCHAKAGSNTCMYSLDCNWSKGSLAA